MQIPAVKQVVLWLARTHAQSIRIMAKARAMLWLIAGAMLGVFNTSVSLCLAPVR